MSFYLLKHDFFLLQAVESNDETSSKAIYNPRMLDAFETKRFVGRQTVGHNPVERLNVAPSAPHDSPIF